MKIGINKKAGRAVLKKIDFKTKTVTRDKRHYITMKVSIQQEDTIMVNIYAPNTGAPKYVKQIFIVHVKFTYNWTSCISSGNGGCGKRRRENGF